MFIKKEIYLSENARNGAQDLVNKMKNNFINIEKDPSCLDEGLYPKEFVEWQVDNFLSFSRFLESRRGKILMERLEDSCPLSSEVDFYDGDVVMEMASVKSIKENR